MIVPLQSKFFLKKIRQHNKITRKISKQAVLINTLQCASVRFDLLFNETIANMPLQRLAIFHSITGPMTPSASGINDVWNEFGKLREDFRRTTNLCSRLAVPIDRVAGKLDYIHNSVRT